MCRLCSLTRRYQRLKKTHLSIFERQNLATQVAKSIQPTTKRKLYFSKSDPERLKDTT